MFSTISSGLTSMQTRMDVNAHNTANLQTPGFRPQRVESIDQNPGVSTTVQRNTNPNNPVEDLMVNNVTNSTLYTANLKMLQTEDQVLGTLLDIQA